MQHRNALAIGALSLITLAVAPVAPAVADGRHSGGHGFHHFGLGGVVADVVVGIVTLPLAIAAAAVSYEPRQYAPEYSGPQGYESGPGNYAPQGYVPEALGAIRRVANGAGQPPDRPCPRARPPARGAASIHRFRLVDRRCGTA